MNITIENTGDKWTALLQGRLDTANASVFEDGIKPLAEHADKDICLDCTDLQYISSSGLRLFLALRKKVAAANGNMVIKNLNSGLKDIFKMTGFTSLFNFE
jgi:anti-sigma B factor antagonist